MGEAAFYTDDARKRVAEAVADVESRTSAEVVVVVHRTSASWRAVDLAVGAAIAFAVLLLVLFHPKPIPVRVMPLDVALAFALGAVLCASVAPFKRLLLPRARVTSQVRLSARSAFVEQGVSRTRGRTGILVYVSTFERRVELVPDVGVDSKLLDGPAEAMARAVAQGADLEGFLAALRTMGPALATALPHAEDDVNELPDAPVMS